MSDITSINRLFLFYKIDYHMMFQLNYSLNNYFSLFNVIKIYLTNVELYQSVTILFY